MEAEAKGGPLMRQAVRLREGGQKGIADGDEEKWSETEGIEGEAEEGEQQDRGGRGGGVRIRYLSQSRRKEIEKGVLEERGGCPGINLSYAV